MPRNPRTIREKPNKLKEYRYEKGFTLMRLVVKAGVGYTTLNAIEHYSYFPTYEVRERIAQALGISEALIWPYTIVNL